MFLAEGDRFHNGLHIVVDAARAGFPEVGGGPVVGVEHQRSAFARTSVDEHHAAAAESECATFTFIGELFIRTFSRLQSNW